MTRRDTRREHTFLRDAADGPEPFVEHAERRLAAGQEAFGDSWSWAGIRRLLTEMREEAADLGSWGVLADQALDHDPALSDLHRHQIRAVLNVAAIHGARAHRELTRALSSLPGSNQR